MGLRVDVPDRLIAGGADEGFGIVAEEFNRNFAERGEVGAACAVYRDGVKVVDLWGGYRDGRVRTPWREDTCVTMYSTTKGVASIALAVAHSRGLFDYDAPVASHWPEFAAAGKERVTVRQLLAHQAGLAVIDEPLDLGVLADHERLGNLLAAQAPAWPPGTRCGYHGVSLGWYESGLLRHVDPSSRSVGKFFAEEVARPLGAEFYIGLPEDFDRDRLATIHGWHPVELLLHMRSVPMRFALAMANRRSLTARTFANPRFGRGRLEDITHPDVLAVEIPASNGTGEVRAVANAYGCLAGGGHKLGINADTLGSLTEAPRVPSGGPRDLVLMADAAYSLGFTRPFGDLRFGTSAGKAFGTGGVGGSRGFADPDVGIGFAYAPNRLGFQLGDDDRELALRRAVYRAIGAAA